MADKSPTKAFVLFALGALVTYGCLIAMQFIPFPWFFIALVAMHGGIALFIVSRITLKRRGYGLLRYYLIEYLMLIPSVIMMIYSILNSVGALPDAGAVKTAFAVIYGAICFVVAVINLRRMQLAARTQSAQSEDCAVESHVNPSKKHLL